jgi:hypothetical protein
MHQHCPGVLDEKKNGAQQIGALACQAALLR